MRLIDADKLKLNVQRYTIPNVDYDGTVSVENAERYFISLLDKAPTEDVMPRAEVEELKKDNEDLQNVLANTINKYRNCETEVARQIFEDLATIFKKHEKSYNTDICELLFEDLGTSITELKKKYIGEQR